MSSPRHKHHFGAIFGKTSPQTRKTRALALPGVRGWFPHMINFQPEKIYLNALLTEENSDFQK